MTNMDVGDRNPCQNGSMYVARIETNADRIRGMSDEELMKFDLSTPYCPERPDDDDYIPDHCNQFTNCWACKLDWLRQPERD